MALIRSANYNLLLEILIRIALFSIFCYLETMHPFSRVIQPDDLHSSLKYPRHESFVSGGVLWGVVLAVPCVLSVLAWGFYSDCNDALETLLTWSLAVGLTGCVTDTVKLIVGRPRPDFFFRCFPDGMELPGLACTGDLDVIAEGRKSFPSGHSSLSWASLGVCGLWLCGRGRGGGGGGGGAGGGRGAALLPGALSARRLHSAVQDLRLSSPLGSSSCCCSGNTSAGREFHSAVRMINVEAKRFVRLDDVLVGSVLGMTMAFCCYRQYYNPVSSDLAGVPYIVSDVNVARYVNGKPDSPSREAESSPLLAGRKEDKWI